MKNKMEEVKKFEYYAANKVLDNCYIAVRVDGRSFQMEVKRLNLKRPFDRKFRNAMCFAAKEVMADFGALFAYTESDECSFLFQKEFSMFERRHEKLVSLMAAKMSASFNQVSFVRDSGTAPIFDARAIVLPSKADVIKYFQWRQMDSHRNCISSYCFWKLVQEGMNNKEAHKVMDRKDDSWKNELLFERFGINYNETAKWQRKGTMLYWKEYKKKGFNPVKKEEVNAIRRKIVVEEADPGFKQDNLKHWINKGGKWL